MDSEKRNGILAGGNWIMDYVKMIDVYPDENALANILEQNLGNGGAPFNVLKAIYKMGFSIPMEGVGVVGDDEMGREILQECNQMGIDSTQLKTLPGESTSFTDVMTVRNTGKRTFFHYRGANSLLGEECFDFQRSSAKLFHLGYLLLLDRLDKVDDNGMSGAAKVFRKARNAGFKTSADIVSEQSTRYKEVISSSLPFIDVLFINELEASRLTDIETCDGHGDFLISKGFEAAKRILQMGVLSWVVIHFPKGAIASSKAGERLFQPGVCVPQSSIKGTVGAGDAFAAGVLAGFHEEWAMEECLRIGVCAAATSLLDTTASGSIKSWEQCLSYGKRLGFHMDITLNQR